MKHEERTFQTKKALAASLKKHMAKMPLNKITVRHLIEDCGVNRKTFYYHFRDIYDLLHWTIFEEAVVAVKHFDLIEECRKAISFAMDYVEKNDHMLNCALDSMGREFLKQFFYEDFIELVRTAVNRLEGENGADLDPQFKELLCGFYTEALAGTMCDWIRNYEKYDKEKTIENASMVLTESLTHIVRQKKQSDV